MKKILIGSALLLGAFLTVMVLKVGTPLPSIHKSTNAQKSSIEALEALPLESLKKASQEVSLETQEYEKEFIKLTDEEINARIQEKGLQMEKDGLLQKGATQELSPEDSQRITDYLRETSALHKILLDRQIEELESEIL